MNRTTHAANSDPVSEALRALRISGAVLLAESYVSPWAVEIPAGAQLEALLGAAPRRTAVPFHLVIEGAVDVRTGAGRTIRIDRGEAVISLRAEPHTLGSGHAATPYPLADLLAPDPRSPGAVGPPTAELMCGAFFLEDCELNPLVASLPDWLRARPSPALRDTFVAEASSKKPGSEYCTSRHLELMLADAIREANRRTPTPGIGPLRGLRDEAVGRALSQAHLRPSDEWSVERLARIAGLSPSRFAARFRETVGVGPIAYVTRLRLEIAGQLLRRTDDRVSEIAGAVGYDSLAAFSRAFKRHSGITPARWRSDVRGDGPGHR